MEHCIIDEDEYWPNCSIADCPFKSCLPSDLCYNHHYGLPLPQEYFDHYTEDELINSDGRIF